MDLSNLNDNLRLGHRVLIAFSGGADSVCLLHHLVQAVDLTYRAGVLCLHVDHGLEPSSSQRANQAQSIAAQLGIDCVTHTLNQAPSSNKEAWARSKRYEWIESIMRPNDVVLTAHHADDVAETMVLRWLRGAGLSGLSGIQSKQSFGPGVLSRPMLAWSKQQILRYLETHALEWIEDPSNVCLEIDRNAVRHRILPVIKERFPGAVEALNRSARLNREAGELLADYLNQDIASLERTHHRLAAGQWHHMGHFQKAEIVRLWCLRQHTPPPPGKPLESFIAQIKHPKPDRLPTLSWADHRMYLYRDHLWLVDVNNLTSASNYKLNWDGQTPVTLPGQLGCLSFTPNLPVATKSAIEKRGLIVQTGTDGEKLLLKAQASPNSVSKLLSLAHIPPWQRQAWPRLWLGDTLLACGSRWQHPDLQNALVWDTNYFGAQI